MTSRNVLPWAASLTLAVLCLNCGAARAQEKVGLSAEQFQERLQQFLKDTAAQPAAIKKMGAQLKTTMNAADVKYQTGKRVTWTIAGEVDKVAAKEYLQQVIREGFVVLERGINKATFDKLEFVVETRAAGAGSGTTTVSTGNETVVTESGCCGCGFFGRLFRRCR